MLNMQMKAEERFKYEDQYLYGNNNTHNRRDGNNDNNRNPHHRQNNNNINNNKPMSNMIMAHWPWM